MSYILILLSFSSYNSGLSQSIEPVFEHFNSQLPSFETYKVLQDSLGYIWLTTDRGITRYDGNSFETIDSDTPFEPEDVLDFFPESNTKLWVSTTDAKLYWFNPCASPYHFTAYPFNDTLHQLFKNTLFDRVIRQIVFKPDHTLLISFLNRAGYLQIDKNGNYIFDNTIYDTKVSTIENMKLNIHYYKDHAFASFKNSKHNEVNIINHLTGDTTKTPIPINAKECIFNVSGFIKRENEIMFTLNKTLIRINNHQINYYTLPERGLSVYSDKDRTLVATSQGVLEYDKSFNLKYHFLKDEFVSSVIKDREDGFWFTTIQNGVFHTKNLSIKEIKKPSEIKPYKLKADPPYLEIHDDIRNTFWVYDIQNQTFDSIQDVGYIQNIIETSNPAILKYKPESTQLLLNFRLPYKNDYTKYTFSLADDTLNFFRGYRNILEKRDSLLFYIQFDYTKSRPISVLESSDSIVLIGTSNGLYSYNPLTYKSDLVPDTEGHYIKQIVQIKNQLFFLTKNTLLINTSGKIKRARYNTSFDLNHINGIYKYNDTLTWVYGRSGIFQMTTGKDTILFTKFVGLPDEEFISMSYHSGKIYVGSHRDIYLLDHSPKQTFGSFQSKLFSLDSIMVNDKIVPISEQIILQPEENLVLFFKLLSYKYKGLLFEYRVDSKKWTSCGTNNIAIQNFLPGEHLIQIRTTQAPDTILYTQSVFVPVPIFRQPWFVIGFILLSTFTLFLLIKIYVDFRERKRKKEIERLNIELKLLTSQMNPHFTFNTINSIQFYILENTKADAIAYLSDFARLIRTSLEYSIDEFIPIIEEVNFLDLYISLENKRFDTNFNIEYRIQEDIRYSKTIPSLMIQPLIENVVVHANYLPEDDKTIIVDISYIKSYFIIKVIDYGRIYPLEQPLKEHKSFGLSILRNRIKLYNAKQYQGSDLTMTTTLPEVNRGKTITIKLKEWTL